MSGNDEGQISDCALVYRDHRDVHRTTRQTHSDVYTHIYTHTRNLRTRVYTYIQTRFKAALWRAAFMGFPCFWPTCSSTLCACSSSKQTNKQTNKQTYKHIKVVSWVYFKISQIEGGGWRLCTLKLLQSRNFSLQFSSVQFLNNSKYLVVIFLEIFLLCVCLV